MKWKTLALMTPMLVVGCSSTYPRPDLSTQERIFSEMDRVAASKSAVAKPIADAMPSTVLDALVQSPMRAAGSAGVPLRSSSTQRFDLIVTDAPIGQVLAGLVEGTQYSIMLKPSEGAQSVSAAGVAAGAEGAGKRVSFKLKNITLLDALDALRDVYGYDYTIENNRILVQPAELQTRLYYVNYILGQRRGVSDIQVIGGASVGQSSSSTVGTSSSSSSSYGSVQASGMSTTVKSDIWSEAEDALRTMLGCTIPKVAASGAAAARPAGSGQNNASRADVSQPGEPLLGERQRGGDGCTQGRALAINAMSGTILVRGMPTELRMAERLLKTMQINISRQVIIEAKVIDVTLNKDSQQGINWSQFSGGLHRMSLGADATQLGVNQSPAGVAGQVGGTVASATSLAALLGTSRLPAGAPANAAGLAIQATNFAALINFLESQGRVHVLSSPRIATLNNQKAVIKVGSEEPFVTNIVGGTSMPVAGGTNQQITQPSLTYQPFFSGIALDVTPQIDAEDNITLHVHSMVNRVTEKAKVALPGAVATVPFAVNSMNETDSVVKARDGQVVVIGGLMSETNSDTRGGVPVARDVPVAGALFNFGNQQASKRELVILLKSTVVKDDSAWSNLISETRERMNDMKIVAPATPR